MRKTARFGVVLGAGLMFGLTQQAKASLVVYYDFNDKSQGTLADLTTITNKAGGASGTFHVGSDVGGSGSIITSGAGAGFGKALQLNPLNDGSSNTGAPNIDTAFTAAALNITPGTPYTAMAWVNFSSTTGDNMIFGGDGNGAANGGAVLHLGTRNGNLHSGHWGDDIGPDQSVNVPAGTGWHHVAYTNDAAGTQTIYLDGVQVVQGATGTAGAMDTTHNLLIGTANNGGSFAGQLDEVKVFNTQLSVTEIQAAMAVPEPTSIATVLVGGISLLMTRRRRADQ